jgi:hypothetical protein
MSNVGVRGVVGFTTMSTGNPPSLRAALRPEALREALVPRRPVFANPWDSTEDAFLCYFAVAVIGPLLLWAGGALMGDIFSFSSHWKLGLFIAANVVGAAGFMTIVGRQRTGLTVDLLVITAWFVLGLVVAPIIGLDFSTAAAIICYAVLLLATLGYVVALGQFERGIRGFIGTLGWPTTWTLLAVFFSFGAYRLLLYQ